MGGGGFSEIKKENFYFNFKFVIILLVSSFPGQKGVSRSRIRGRRGEMGLSEENVRMRKEG